MIDAVRLIMHGMEREPVFAFTGQETARWPCGLLAALIDSGILRETQMMGSVWCDECGNGCSITPDFRVDPKTGGMTSVYLCPKDGHGPVSVPQDWLRQWQSNRGNLAKWLCKELALAPGPASIAHGQLYLLGTRPTTGGLLDVFLAYGLSCGSGYDLVMQNMDRLQATPGAVIIMPASMPVPGIWPILKARWLTLADLLRWDTEQRRLDASTLVKEVESTCPLIRAEQWITVSQGAQLLVNDLPYLDVKKAAARISKAANTGKFMTNGKAREERRIERISFDAWRLEQRDRALDAEEDDR